ncbi:fibronectin type III domain-containing protein [Steroidobacter flavus]|uniref:Fibronectin type III domain-containing protein n=1 Tax=Steroidobacter flavus TaxID=1842136 RepID=A0ABV8T3H4_9GAMM
MHHQRRRVVTRTFNWVFWMAQLFWAAAFAQDTQPPTTPTNLAAIASSSTGVVVNWNPSTDDVAVTGYQVERCQGSACNTSFTQFNISSTGWANSGLTPSTTYGYRVRARDAVPNYSAYTTIVYVTTKALPDTQAPTTPTNLTAVASSSTGVVVNWNPSTDNVAVTGYQLERCQGSGCTSSFTQFDIASAGWANTGLTPSTTYGYRVRALDAVPNYSAFTNIVYVTTQSAGGDTQAPTTPTNFTAVASSSTGVVINWNPSTDNVAVTGYQVERCQGSGCNSAFVQFDISSAGWANSGLAASTTYGYRVRARDAVPNYSAFTSIVYVTTPGSDTQAPTIPGSLSVTAGPNQLTLAWTGSTDNVAVTAYLIERCSGSPCTYTQIASVSGTSYTDTNVVVATSYSYRVRARDAVPNYSGYSSVISALPAACD